MLYFEKYQGTGNDFIILDGRKTFHQDIPKLALEICDRHFGVGADGLIIVSNSNVCDIKMEYYNADGSIAHMCGNGIRCFAKYVFEHNIVNKTNFVVETLAGHMNVLLYLKDNNVDMVRINIGIPEFNIKRMAVITKKATIINEPLILNGKEFNITVLTLGTLNCVVFLPFLDLEEICCISPMIEKNSLFPEGVNVNFCEIIDENHLKVITYERGVGITKSCGTGSSAVAVVSSMINKTMKNVIVEVPGGTLNIEQINEEVFLTGPAEIICSGNYAKGKDWYSDNEKTK